MQNLADPGYLLRISEDIKDTRLWNFLDSYIGEHVPLPPALAAFHGSSYKLLFGVKYRHEDQSIMTLAIHSALSGVLLGCATQYWPIFLPAFIMLLCQ
jgi:cytoplasmic iron level regulating protein YaaA (DUF328/UPF0246 family)